MMKRAIFCLCAALMAAAPPAAGQPRAWPENRSLLRLSGGGLAVGTPGLHSRDHWEFGLSRAEIVAAVTGAAGPATGTGENRECGAGPMQFTRFGPLTLNFQDDRWVGWDMAWQTLPAIVTEDGLTIGVGRNDLDLGAVDRDEVTVNQTTLGTEFEVSGIHGLLSGRGPDATVTHLWAGTDCAFR